MEWLIANLSRAFPFADGSPESLGSVVADGWVATSVVGPLYLVQFVPGALTNANVLVQDEGGNTVLATTAATVTALGEFSVLEAQDSVRGSSYRFIVHTAAANLYPGLLEDATLAAEACVALPNRVTSLNGLQGDVQLVIDAHVSAELVDGQLVLTAAEPEDRVDCASADCAKVFSLNEAKPDEFGSAVLTPDGCYRLVPHPTLANTLLLYNHCTPCLECADVDALDAAFVVQADYYHQLSAIYHDQFNRYQDAVANANARVAAQEAAGAMILPCGTVDIGGRAFGRPYFSQTVLAIINSSTYALSVEVQAVVTPVDLALVLEPVEGSALVQRSGPNGASQATHTGFPGTITVLVGPGETVAVSGEVHLSSATLIGAGTWTMTATVTFTGGCPTLPAAQVVVKELPFTLGAAPATEDA